MATSSFRLTRSPLLSEVDLLAIREGLILILDQVGIELIDLFMNNGTVVL